MAVTYSLFVEPEVHATRGQLPGNVRQRIRAVLEGLAGEPRPSTSRSLRTTGLDLPPGVEIRRVRLDRWRVVYAVSDTQEWVWVLAVRQRPPYRYDDLDNLAARIGGTEP